MIAVDTSALVAIAFGEPEAAGFLAAMRSTRAVIGAPILAEARIVIESKSAAPALAVLDEILALPSVHVEPFEARHEKVAHDAHRRFGKGRGHPAQLNICDCFSYAIAACDDLPLLLKGGDFRQTDIRVAVP